MKRLPNTLDNILYHMHQKIWEQGTESNGSINPATLEIFDSFTTVVGLIGYDVEKYKEYIGLYKFRLKEERKQANDYQI